MNQDEIRDRMKVAGFTAEFVDSDRVSELHEQEWGSWSEFDTHGNGEFSEVYYSLEPIAAGKDSYDQVSTVRRSNYRTLRRDFPEVQWVDKSYSDVNVLGILLSDLEKHDESHGLVELLIKLKNDYPVYDEEDLSNLEYDEIRESITQFVIYDVTLPEGEIADAWDNLNNDQKEEMILEYLGAASDVTDYPEHNGIEIIWDFKALQEWLTEKLS